MTAFAQVSANLVLLSLVDAPGLIFEAKQTTAY
jgi:hypothetical protein